jgi:hypothetical protein
MGSQRFRIVEHSGATSSAGILTPDPTNLTLDAFIADMALLRAAIEGVVLGVVSRQILNAVADDIAFVLPPKTAQRELAWLVRGTDGNGNPQRVSLGTADFNLVAGNTDKIDTGLAAWTDLKSELEKHWVSNAGSPVTANDAILVGRVY